MGVGQSTAGPAKRAKENKITAGHLMGWPISGLHCHLTHENVFCVELTKTITRIVYYFSIIGLANGVWIEESVESEHPEQWRCTLNNKPGTWAC